MNYYTDEEFEVLQQRVYELEEKLEEYEDLFTWAENHGFMSRQAREKELIDLVNKAKNEKDPERRKELWDEILPPIEL